MLLLVPVGTAFASAPAGAEAASPSAVAAGLAQQVNAIEADKEARSPAQRKIDSQLIYRAREDVGRPAVAEAPRLRAEVTDAPDGRLVVDVDATVTDRLGRRIEALGGTVVSSVPSLGSMRILLPVAQAEALAAEIDVRQIRPADRTQTNGVDPRAGPPRDLTTGRAATSPVERALGAALSEAEAPTGATYSAAGSVSSEGDTTHKADLARARFGTDGRGVKVGVLSDGVAGLAARQESGDLGPVTVLAGQAGPTSGVEGTAMLEIVHDLAPGAELFFATADNGVASFAQNIRNLRAAGCDIIVDDVLFERESGFQDGLIAQAVNSVTAAGALYFSAAGNTGNLDDGTSGTWEGDFASAGTASSPGGIVINGGTFHDFDPGPAVAVQNPVARTGGTKSAVLFWSDPLGASANDYDLFLTTPDGTSIEASSTNAQTGFQDPFEAVRVPEAGAGGRRLLVFKKAGAADRFIGLYLHGNEFDPVAGSASEGLPAFSTRGSIRGHNGGQSTISIAATPAARPQDPNGPTGPFPNPHTAANISETFTSDGPRRVFFRPDGTPVTPGNVSATGGTLLMKPDLTAADGVTTVAFAPRLFFGTSAAAPHAAAIAALVKGAKPTANADQVKAALAASAIDIEAPGHDPDTGLGIVMADSALSAVGAVPPPQAAPTFTASSPATSGILGARFGPYSFTASGSPAPAFAVASGSLPPGLTLTATGLLSGTLTVAGAFTFTVRATNGVGPDAVSSPITITVSSPPVGSTFAPLSPARLWDSRTGPGPVGLVGAGQTRDITVTGVGGVPATGVTAVVLNVTAINPTAGTFVTAWPTGETRPNASNLNVPPNDIRPNLVIVKVGAGGKVSFYNDAGNVNLVADIAGWYGPTGGQQYTAVSPSRVWDSRSGPGPTGRIGAGQFRDVTVTGLGGVPAAGVTAVVLNVTAAAPTASTFVTAWPTGETRPNASNLNVPANDVRPNLVIVKVGAGGRVSFYNESGNVDLLADVAGYYGATGSGFTSVSPARLWDSRGTPGPAGRIGAGQSRDITVTGVGGVPASGVTAVVLNVTAAAPTARTFVTAWPTGEPKPNASNLNVPPGDVRPNLVIVKVGAGGKVSFNNDAGDVDLIADVAGWYGTTGA